MKQVIAVIAPHLADSVLMALQRAPLEGLCVHEVHGYGRQKSYLDQYSDNEFSTAFTPKVEISFWVDDARLDEVLDKIVAITRTGRIGDGKIMVMPVASVQ